MKMIGSVSWIGLTKKGKPGLMIEGMFLSVEKSVSLPSQLGTYELDTVASSYVPGDADVRAGGDNKVRTVHRVVNLRKV